MKKSLQGQLIDPYYKRKYSLPAVYRGLAYITCVLIGIVLTVLVDRVQPPKFSVNKVNCYECHMPKLNNNRQYKAHHNAIRNYDAKVLAELVRSDK